MAQKLRREIEAQNYQSKKTLSSGAQYQAEYFQTASGMHMKYGGYIYHRMDQTPNYTKWRCINALLEEKRCYVTAKVVNEIVAVLQEHNHDPDKNGLISLELTHRKRKSGNSSKNSISKEVSEDAHGIQVSQFGFAYFYCKHCRKDYPFTGPSSIRAHILSNHHIQNATLSQSVNKTMSDDSNQKSEYKYKESYTKCFTGIQPSSKGDTYFYCACCLLNAPILHQQTVQFHVGTRKHIERLKLYKKMLSLRSNKQEKSVEEDKEETLKSE
uniref:Uncharacterized protein n=1 Tax=Acrobeloides nanus TaxID=290746 RepID=A0A914E5Y0_9BILA